MNINDSLLTNSEKILFSLRNLYTNAGFVPYRMSKFEEYDLYAKNKDFLVSDNVITFTDTSGKLMALKPDVTLSIIKNSKDIPNSIQKVFYNENVYRVSKGTGSYKEIMQSGVECFGNLSNKEIADVILLAANSLKTLSSDSILAVSNLDVLKSFAKNTIDETALFTAISEKNIKDIKNLCDNADSLIQLLSFYGNVKEISSKINSILGDEFGSFKEILSILSKNELAENIYLDFSVTDDINYYNGIVFKGFIRNHPNCIISGGQYDSLMKKLSRTSRAIGFAVYTDELEYLEDYNAQGDDFINIALPKGRLGEKIYSLFAKAGYECPSVLEPNRKLSFENTSKKVRYFWVKPSDVAIYVERGAADIGVAGKDILLEYEPDVYELLDTKKGKCQMTVSGPANFADDPTKTLRVATKFSNIAKQYYRSLGRDIDIIHLNGSIEIAPILGLSDVIVDIVETGMTLKENNLKVLESIVPISARLIANKASCKFKNDAITTMVNTLSNVIGEEND